MFTLALLDICLPIRQKTTEISNSRKRINSKSPRSPHFNLSTDFWAMLLTTSQVLCSQRNFVQLYRQQSALFFSVLAVSRATPFTCKCENATFFTFFHIFLDVFWFYILLMESDARFETNRIEFNRIELNWIG